MASLGDLTGAARERDPDPLTFDFHGDTFTVADPIAEYTILAFARYATEGVDTSDMVGMAAIADVIDTCIDPDDLARFQHLVKRERVSTEELLKVVEAILSAVAARPTRQPSDSSGGLPVTTATSRVVSSSPVTELRPDLTGLASLSEVLSG